MLLALLHCLHAIPASVGLSVCLFVVPFFFLTVCQAALANRAETVCYVAKVPIYDREAPVLRAIADMPFANEHEVLRGAILHSNSVRPNSQVGKFGTFGVLWCGWFAGACGGGVWCVVGVVARVVLSCFLPLGGLCLC